MMHVATGWTVIDEFCARFVYFYSGYLFATYVFGLSDRARAHPAFALAGLALWTLINGCLVFSGFSEWPLISLTLGLAGACAIVVIGTLLARARWLEPTLLRRALHRHLSGILPADGGDANAAVKFGLIHDIGAISLIVTIAGILGRVDDLVVCAARRLTLCSNAAAFGLRRERRVPGCRRRSNPRAVARLDEATQDVNL